MISTSLSVSERQELRDHYFSRASKQSGVYLANHSLGRPLDQMVESLDRFTDAWFTDMDTAWDTWLDEISTYQSRVADLLGHPRPDGIIPKTSAGQGLRAVLNSLPADNSDRPINVVTTATEFDSIDFILKVYEQKGKVNLVRVSPSLEEQGVPLYRAEDLFHAITRDTDLLVYSQVNFTTGQVMPRQEELIARAHSCGALVLADTYHSFGVITTDFTGLDLDFAIGGSYKYVHGGPGSCWLAVAPRHLDEHQLVTLDTGWFAKKDLFGYQRTSTPERADDGRAWWESTPPLATIYQATPGLQFLQMVTIDRLRATSLHDQEHLRKTLGDQTKRIYQPSDPESHGAFSLLVADNPDHAKKITKHLKDNQITVDSRDKFVRLCPDLVNTLEDFEKTALALQNQ